MDMCSCWESWHETCAYEISFAYDELTPKGRECEKIVGGTIEPFCHTHECKPLNIMCYTRFGLRAKFGDFWETFRGEKSPLFVHKIGGAIAATPIGPKCSF